MRYTGGRSSWRAYVTSLTSRSVGLRDTLSTFIRNLFSDHSFSVSRLDLFSRTFSLLERVPQGSVLSILCFVLAFNDVVSSLPDGIRYSLYVDDFVIYVLGSYLHSMESGG